jgi:hypothetical protein
MGYASFTNLPTSVKFPAHSVDDGKAVSASAYDRRHNVKSGITARVRSTATLATPIPSKVQQIMGVSDFERPSPTRAASYHLMCKALEVQPLALVRENAADFQ